MIRRHLTFVVAFGVISALVSCWGAEVGLAAIVLHIDDGANNLGTVNLDDGTVSVIGNMGGDTMTDIAFDGSGNLYGVSFNRLYQINTATAAAALVGNLGLSDQNALVFGADGTLYAAGNSSGNLYTINTITGAATLRGNIGHNSSGDLAFNGGSLYMSSSANQLIRITLNPGNTVTSTVVGNLGFANVFGLATGGDGVLYGVSNQTIFSINTTTGAGTFVRTYSGGLGSANGTSFIDEVQTAAEVPEPAAIMIWTIGAVGCAVATYRRKNLAA